MIHLCDKMPDASSRPQGESSSFRHRTRLSMSVSLYHILGLEGGLNFRRQ